METSKYAVEKDEEPFNKLTITLLYPNNLTGFDEASDFIDIIYEIIENLSSIGHAGIVSDDPISMSELYDELHILETDSHYYIPYTPDTPIDTMEEIEEEEESPFKETPEA